MNWVDAIAAAVMVVSVLVAAVRGFAREVLGVFAWAGALAVAIWGFPYVEPRFLGWIGDPNVATVAAYAALFLGALILFSIMTGMVGGLVRASPLSGLDTTLGLVFGAVRGALLLVAAYIGFGLIVEPARWPAPLREARSTPWIYQGAVFAADLLPPNHRPAVKAPPLLAQAPAETTTEQLLLPPLQPAAPAAPAAPVAPAAPAAGAAPAGAAPGGNTSQP